MDQGAESQAPEGVVGPTAVEDEVAVGRRRRLPGTSPEDPPGVRAPPQAAPRSLRRRQGRLRLRPPGHPLLHGPLRVRLQGQ